MCPPIASKRRGEGLKGEDVARAPGSQVLPSAMHPTVGDQLLQLKAGGEIVSETVMLLRHMRGDDQGHGGGDRHR